MKGVQRVAAYRTGPEGNNASAITNVLAKAKALLGRLIPSGADFSPSFA